MEEKDKKPLIGFTVSTDNKNPLIGFRLLTDNKKAEKSKESDIKPDEDGDFPEKARN